MSSKYQSEADKVSARITTYLSYPFFRVQGYCPVLDAEFFREIIVHQARQSIQGALVEIGVWHGQSFLILALGRTRGEKCLGIDLFETRVLFKGEKKPQIDAFKENCAKNFVTLDTEEIFAVDTKALASADILSRVGRSRLVHIDGAHDYDHVMHDLNLARDILVDQAGVIIMDDTFNYNWPETGAAAFDWVRKNTDFVAWAATPNKLYLCRKNNTVGYTELVRNRFSGKICRNRELFGSSYISVCSSQRDNIREKILRKLLTCY